MRYIFLWLLSLTALATEPVLMATMGSKASVSFGGKPVTLAIGESRDGVKLISVGVDSAVFESGGKRSTVQLGQGFFAGGNAGADKGSSNSATLFDAGGGHFMAMVTANGGSVRGLIDTGASALALSEGHARALNLRVERDRPVRMQTAQGTKIFWLTRLDSLKLEGITLYGVEAVVADGDYPAVPLIGMTVLNQLQMQRDGNTMVLKKKY
ncbi:retropepsin-like aspartic protease family protein [Chitinimonas naiadis]